MNTIAIDCGASFIKGAVIVDGDIVFEIKHQSPIVHEKNIPIVMPLQIKELESQVLKIYEKLLQHLEGDVYTFCVSNEMHGFLLVDEQGEAITDYISWQVSLDDGLGKRYFEQSQFAKDIENTGMQLREGLPLCNLWSILRYELPANKVSRKIKYRFCDLGSYVLERISGKRVDCHPTNAGATGIYDLRTGNFNWKLVDEIIGDTGYCVEFPAVGEKEIRIGNVTYKPAIGDHQAALLGANLHKFGQVSFNLGTGAQVAIIREEYQISNRWQVQPYFEGKYVHRIPFLPSGRGLNVFFRFFKSIFNAVGTEVKDEVLWETIQRSSKKKKQLSLSVDLSFFENKVTDYTVGNIQNIGEYDLTFENVVISVLHQMAENFKNAALILLDDELDSVQEICFTGGIAKKFECIREDIVSGFSAGATIRMVEGETFLGLDRYANIDNEEQQYEN